MTGEGMELPRDELLALMDLNFVEMWRQMTRAIDGAEIHEFAGLTIVSTPHGEALHNPILVRDVTNTAEVALAIARWVRPLGRPYSLFTRQHDPLDEALSTQLQIEGWVQPFAEPAMALDGAAWAASETARRAEPPPPDLEVRPVGTEPETRAYGALIAAAYGVYGLSATSLESFFTRQAAANAENIQSYLGWVQGRAVSGATLYTSHGVAGIGWVGTHPETFGRGYGRKVVAAALDDGFRRGCRVANLQASLMGQRMYERMGFTIPTWYRVHLPPAE